MRAQQIPVFRRRQNARRGRDAAQVLRPRLQRREPARNLSQRRVVHVRHLHREHAARRQERQQPREQVSDADPPSAARHSSRSDRAPRTAATGRSPPARTGTAAPWHGPSPASPPSRPRRSPRPTGKRCRRMAVTLPGPQPRSTTRAGASSGTCASRSSAGRNRSPANCRYCAGSQTAADRAISMLASGRGGRNAA